MQKSQIHPAVPLATLLLVASLVTQAASAKAPEGEPYSYKQVGDKQLMLYVTKPADWAERDRRPAIVFFHGGGWVGGSPGQFTDHSKYFASRGIVCFQIQYRLLRKDPDAPPTTCIQDAKSAMRWIRSHSAEFGIDPQRIASGGGSAGGHLAAHVGCVDGGEDPDDGPELAAVTAKSNAMLLFNPVYNNGPEGWGVARVGERYPEFSPAHNISKDDPPSIVFLGGRDKLIPVAVAEKFRDDSHSVGIVSELHVYRGQGHGFFNATRDDGKWYRKTVIAADRFLGSLGWVTGEPTLHEEDRR